MKKARKQSKRTAKMKATLDDKKILDGIINNAVEGAVVMNQKGSEEKENKDQEAEVFIPSPKK